MHCFFGTASVNSLVIPWCTYTEPQVAHVGLYASDLQSHGIRYVEFKREMSEVDRATLDSDTDGFIQILVKEGTDEILGATIVAADAGDLISEITTAIVTHTGLATLSTVIHPYPTQAEGIRQVGDMYNRTKLTPTVKVLFRKLLESRR